MPSSFLIPPSALGRALLTTGVIHVWGSWLPLGFSLGAGGGDGRLDFGGGDSGILQREMFIFLQVTQRKFRCLIELLSHVKASSELNREILSRPTKEGGRYS